MKILKCNIKSIPYKCGFDLIFWVRQPNYILRVIALYNIFYYLSHVKCQMSGMKNK